MNTMVGTLKEKSVRQSKAGKDYLVINVNGVSISAWDGVHTAAAIIDVGKNVEVSYETNEKGFHNLKNIALAADGAAPTPPVSSPTPSFTKPSFSGSYKGKSPEERMSIQAQNSSTNASVLLVPWITAKCAKDPGWFEDNWEQVAKAHANLTVSILDALIVTLGGKV